jgi:hypothetical protein
VSRTGAVAALTVIVLVLGAGPALADPAEPTNYRSIVTAVDPAPTGVAIEIVGGDAFLSIAAAEGHTVLVPGYFGEPYLRIDPDGAVYLNTKSPARYINQDRYGASEIPDSVDAEANPEWEQVGSGGRFAWHDHRVHWMSPDLPPTVSGDRVQIVFPWTISIFVDGVETELKGELFWFPSTNPAGPLLTGFLGILPFLAWKPGRLTPVAIAAAGVGALMLLVAVVQFGATPSFDRGFPVAAVFPAIAVVGGVAALWLGSASIRSWALVATSGLALLWWTWGISSALTAPVLPSALPVGLERGAVSLAGWIAVGLIAIAGYELIRSTRTTPELEAMTA